MKQNVTASFAPFGELMPQEALNIPFAEVYRQLAKMVGEALLLEAFDPDITIPGPFNHQPDGRWLRTTRCVGINVRTLGDFWQVIPYALTLPEAACQAIHLLPIWEPGVVSSLYAPASWNINPAFFSPALREAFPALDSVEKQLKVTVNLLHLLKKAAGMDVVPHTDRYSEQVLANPQLFEWLQRRDHDIIRHDSDLYHDVESFLLDYLHHNRNAVHLDVALGNKDNFFRQLPESMRLQLLFGRPEDHAGRLQRRKELVVLLHERGLETAPATMAPPYRGLKVDPRAEALVVDEDGLDWRDYNIIQPQEFSRVFGPLTRYRLYESKNNNQDWMLDFDRPNRPAWSYVCTHYATIQERYGFDFMRGDMSHVQMRPDGVPQQPGAFYDLLGAVKQHIAARKPSFGYFAESFLAPPDTLAYGDECDHLEAADADSTLGDLQSEPVGTVRFRQLFWQYRQWLETRRFAPNFTLMTADKDDPRFDAYYLDGNEVRYFLGLFLTDMPMYMGAGFECRDPHTTSAPNEHYSKLYVFHFATGPKATHGPFQWGRNRTLYERIGRQRRLAEAIFPEIKHALVEWLVAPDPEGLQTALAWTQRSEPIYIFAANLDTEASTVLTIPLPPGEWEAFFSTHQQNATAVHWEGQALLNLEAGEGRVLRQV